MKIIKKTIKDRVPKMVMLTIVNNMRDYCKTELLAAIYSSGLDHKQLMEESSGEEERRESMFRMHSGIKDALQIISDINVNTIRSDEPTGRFWQKKIKKKLINYFVDQFLIESTFNWKIILIFFQKYLFLKWFSHPNSKPHVSL